MKALDRLRQMVRNEGCVSFASCLDQESAKIGPPAGVGLSRGACLSEQLTNYLRNNDIASETPPFEPLDSGTFLETGTDTTDEASPWPELPPLPDDDEHARWLRGEVGFAHAFCQHCRKALGERALVDIGHGV
jgi:hypothetical protein